MAVCLNSRFTQILERLRVRTNPAVSRRWEYYADFSAGIHDEGSSRNAVTSVKEAAVKEPGVAHRAYQPVRCFLRAKNKEAHVSAQKPLSAD